MDLTQIKESLKRLHADLDARESVDPELRKLLVELDTDIHELLEASDNDAGTTRSMVDRLEALDTQFAGKYPTIERFARELIDALGRMGI